MIGHMKHRVTIQEAVLTPDGAGGFTHVWQDIAEAPEVFAAITPVSGAEQFRFGQLQATATHHIVVRYRGDITTAMRLVEGDVTYTMASLKDRDGSKTYLEILAMARPS